MNSGPRTPSAVTMNYEPRAAAPSRAQFPHGLTALHSYQAGRVSRWTASTSAASSSSPTTYRGSSPAQRRASRGVAGWPAANKRPVLVSASSFSTRASSSTERIARPTAPLLCERSTGECSGALAPRKRENHIAKQLFRGRLVIAFQQHAPALRQVEVPRNCARDTLSAPSFLARDVRER